MSEITSQTVMEEWCARVGNISDRQAPAWKRILCGEFVRDMDIALEAVKDVAAEVERGQHKRTPGLTHFEKAYKSCLARFERQRYETDGEPEGCESCRKSGLVAVVMAWSVKDKRYKPVPRTLVPFCEGWAYRCYVPCTCAKGMGINAAAHNYSRDILSRLHQHCAYEVNAQADNHLMRCIKRKQRTEQ